MFRKLIRSSLNCQKKQKARLSEIKEYLCLRETLSGQANKAHSEQFNALAKKYNLQNQELLDLIKYLQNDVTLLEKYINYEDFSLLREDILTSQRFSPFYQGEASSQELRTKYADVYNYLKPSETKQNGLKDLEEIFLNNGPSVQNLGNRTYGDTFFKTFEERILSHISELKSQNAQKGAEATTTIDRIVVVLRNWVENFRKNPALEYGKLAAFLEFYRELQGKNIAVRSQNDQASRNASSSYNYLFTSSLSASDIAETDNLNKRELELFFKEESAELREPYKYYFLPWVNNKKLVFASSFAETSNLLPLVAGAGLGVVLLYALYQGDVSYSEYLAIDVLALTAAAIWARRSLRGKFKYLTEMQLHRDGRNVDIVVQNNFEKLRIDNVPISQIKLLKTAQTVNVSNKVGDLSFLRVGGLGGNTWVAEIGGNQVLVPIDYQGNNLVVDSILEGKNVDTTNL